MKTKSMTIKEKVLYYVWCICKILSKPFNIVGNWAADRLNKSYFNTSSQIAAQLEEKE